MKESVSSHRLLATILRRNAMIGLVGLCAMAAWLVPDLGATGGPLRPEITMKVAVAVIFLFQGLLLPLEAIRAGLTAWKLHVVTQVAIFVVAPICAWLLTLAARPWLIEDLRMGILYLGVLPTTVATAAALTAQARGNVSGALFNTCLANIAGIVIVPTAVAMFVTAGSGEVALWPLMKSIMAQLLLPLLAGQALRPWLGARTERHRKGVGRINGGLILFMLFAALCNAVQDRVWERGGAEILLWSVLGAVALLLLLTGLTLGMCRGVGLGRGDTVAALFCGSQKTLAAGVPLAQTIFAATGGEIGIILLPLVFYHPFQLTLGVILAMRWEREPALEIRPPE